MTSGDADRTRALSAPAPRPAGGEVLLQIGIRSDKGLVRENNEDSFLVADLAPGSGGSGETTAGVGAVGTKGVLLAVSDGMGGQAAGEIASRLAVEHLRAVLRTEWSDRPERDAVAELRNDFRTAVDRANKAVLEHVEQNPGRAGMGATLTAAVVLGRTLVVAHVGDSRCYLLREGFLKCLTADQCLAEELVRRGVVERDSPAFHARKSVLTRVVGQTAPLVPDSEIVDLARGDRILVCSDGLYGAVNDDVIREILAEEEDPDAAVEALVDAAKVRGAPDNVTVIAAWVTGDGLPLPSEIDGGGGTQSIRFDPRLAVAAGEDTVALALARKDATAEFEPRKILEDDTLGNPATAPRKEAPPAPAAAASPAPPAPAPAPPAPSAPPPAPAAPPPPAAAAPGIPRAALVVGALVALLAGLALVLHFTGRNP